MSSCECAAWPEWVGAGICAAWSAGSGLVGASCAAADDAASAAAPIARIQDFRIIDPPSRALDYPDRVPGAFEHPEDRLDFLGRVLGAQRAAQQRHSRGRRRWAGEVDVE